MTQSDIILQHLKKHGNITTWQAIQQYGITRLSAKIFTLRKNGIKIENEEVHKINRYGVPVTFVKYVLVEKENNNGNKKN